MRQIGFYFLFILSFVNIEIWGMKAEEEMNWEKEFNNNYCITDGEGNILNLSDLKELTLSEDKKQKLNTLQERLKNNEINIVEFCTDEENTIKFKVIEEGKKIDGHVTFFSCIDKSKDMENKGKLCIGIAEDTILITKDGQLKNCANKNEEIKKTKELFLVKKTVKKSLIFDKSFNANNAKNDQKTEFELSLLYLTIRQEMQKGLPNLKYENKIHKFLFGYNKLYYYWDEIKNYIYFFQYYTGTLVFCDIPLEEKEIKALKEDGKCVVHEMQDQKLLIPDPDVEGKKSCCQKCCDNCF